MADADALERQNQDLAQQCRALLREVTLKGLFVVKLKGLFIS